MSKWTTLIGAIKQESYELALQELAMIRDYDDLQDALQVVPFKSLNQDLPESLLLLEKLYNKFMSLANDREEGRLIIRHVFKADLLLKNFIRVEVESVLVGAQEQGLKYNDLIGHIAQITCTMDHSVVDEMMSYSLRLKSALEHYQASKSLLTDFGFAVDEIKSNLKSCLTKYHSFVRHLEALTTATTRKYSGGKGHTVIYKEGCDSSKKGTTRYNTGHSQSPSRSRSLVQVVTSHRGSVEQVRKRWLFNKAVLDVVEPSKEDIERAPRLLQSLRGLVENDSKFLDVMTELSSHITNPCFAAIKLDKILGHFISSYDGILSAVNEVRSTKQESAKKDLKVMDKKMEDTTSGLVDHGLKIDVTASLPFRRRVGAIRLTSQEQKERRGVLRAHSCRDSRAEERGEPTVLLDRRGSESAVQESKLQEKLAMKEKQLAETRSLVKNLKKREEQLLEKLTAQAKNHLMRSEKFENISDDLPRSEQLIKQYDDLYSQQRLDAMDDLDNIESINCLKRSDEVKTQISFAVMTVSFHLAGQELDRRRRKIYSLLGVDQRKLESGNCTSVCNEILLQLRRSASEIDLKHVVDEVMDGLCSTLHDFPELTSCQELRHFAEACVRFSWTISNHVPPLTISYDAASFTSSMHNKSHNSEKDSESIRYYVWPSLLDSRSKEILFKGIVTT